MNFGVKAETDNGRTRPPIAHIPVTTEGKREYLLRYETALQFYSVPPAPEIITLDYAESLVAERINSK